LVIDCANEGILKIWGKNAGVIGKPLLIALPELEGQPFLQILDDVYTGGQPYYGSEAPVTLEQDGKPAQLFVNFVYQPIYGKDGTATDIMVVANDVTEQVNSRLVLKQKNEELSLLAEQLAYVSNTIPQQVWTATPDGLLDFVNQQTVQYFGRPESELTGENWIKVVHPGDLEAAGKAWLHSLATGEPYQTEFRLLSKEGNYIWHLARATAFIENEKIVKWFGTNTDIDGHKQLEQHKTDFISIASHELKTPITSLKASLQLLNRLKDSPDDTLLPKLIDQCNRGIEKISSLINDLLSVSRMNEGQVHLKKTKFVTGELLNTCCSYVTAEGKYEIVIEGNAGQEIFADEHLVEQVVVNLVNNAIKYAPGSKVIRLTIAATSKEVKIAVIDQGPGISADKLPHLFDRYYRVDYSGKQYSGLGLGLYICSEIIKRHGGHMGVESGLGKGSTFWFTLPL
jgi:two-component system sensor histidine kinase VicK